MEKEEKPKRNEKGDLDFGDHKFDWERFNWWRYTFVFNHFVKERGYHYPYFNLGDHDEEALHEARNDPEYEEVTLYKIPAQPPFDFYIHYYNWELDLLVKYFKEVFEERAFIDGYQPQNKYYRLILPRSIHHKILNVINNYELLPIRDLILEIIATAQNKYIQDVFFWDRPENQKIITTAKKESLKAMRIIEKSEDKWLNDLKSKRPPELMYINFVFQDEAIKISHPWLAKEFIDHFKKYYNDLSYKNWRLDLERYPNTFTENVHKQQFKYRLAISLYNLLTKEQFFIIKKSNPYPNDILSFIAKIIEFCLIPVGSFDETDDVKIKHIRNWLKRKELREEITYLSVPPNKERLLKYFDEHFIKQAGDNKRADALVIAAYLSKRFDVPHLINDLAHLAEIMKSWHFFIGSRFMYNSHKEETRFPELIAFDNLVQTIKSKKKITNLKFKVEGDDNEYEFAQRLPLHLIEQALKEHIEDHAVEFEVDIVKSQINKLPNGAYQVKNEQVFNLPEERFMVHFVASFYQYLLHEAPPCERDYLPSKRYYAIIANMLQKTWFFSHQNNPEWFIIAKVEQWHKLAGIK